MLEIENRIFVDAYNSALKDVDYKRNTQRAIKLGSKIVALLDNNSLLFLEYEQSAGLAGGIYQEIIYRMGVEDGLMQYNKSL
ncbi:MAG: hypothetical protein WA125_13645 [Desulfosporosinus sp.]